MGLVDLIFASLHEFWKEKEEKGCLWDVLMSKLWNSQPSPVFGSVCGLHPNKMGWTMYKPCDSCTSLCMCSYMNTHACGCTVCKDICASV